MQIQEQTTGRIGAEPKYAKVGASTKINIDLPDAAPQEIELAADGNLPTPLLFDHIARTTLAERYPLLTCAAISFSLLACALMTEVEALKGSGYFWR